jgi:hypothetical protein
MVVFFTERWKEKSKSSSVFVCGKREAGRLHPVLSAVGVSGTHFLGQHGG